MTTSHTTTKLRHDVYADVTNAIVAAIEADPSQSDMPRNTCPWHRGGTLTLPTNIVTGNAYQGINIVSLWACQELRGYDLPIWGTYKQWQAAGCQVRKGEKSALVVFYKEYEVDAVDEGDDGKRRVARASYAFNAAQVDGFEPPVAPEDLGPIARMARADAFVAATGAKIEVGGARACYVPSADAIHMPDEGLFRGTASMDRSEAFYAVLLHELTHWSGSSRRLDRQFGERFGDEAYAMEELVAELGAAFLCARLGLTLEPRADHAQYIATWLTVLKRDTGAIFAAAAKASEAARFLKRFSVAPG